MEPHERLKLARERAGIPTAKEAAARYGWTEVTYRAHENGTRGLTRDNVKPYAKAFKVREGWLLTGEGDPPVDADMAAIVEIFPRLSPRAKKAVLAAAEAFADRDSEQDA